MKEITKNYSNGEVTIVWKPAVCIHSTKCWKGEMSLPEVFNPHEKPWIKPEGAETARIIEQVNRCPSGALSYFRNQQPESKEVSNEVQNETIVEQEQLVEVSPNGPLLVYGNITVKDSQGNTIQKNKVTAFCRCGNSGNKPYCDGTHRKIGFQG